MEKIVLRDFNYFYIILYIWWLLIQSVILKIEGIGIIMAGFGFFTLLLNLNYNYKRIKKTLSDKPTFLFLLLVLYTFINWNFKSTGYSGRDYLQFVSSFITSPLIFFIIVKTMLKYDNEKCEKILLLALLSFSIICALFFQESEQVEGRKTVEGIGNILPLYCVSAIGISIILFFQKRMDTTYIFGIIVILFPILFMTASRKAFGAVLILLLGFYLAGAQRHFFKRMISGFATLAIIYFASDWLMSSLFFSRLTESNDYDVVVLTSNPAIDKFLMIILGDRAQQYADAFLIIPNNLFTGIGLHNYVNYNYYELTFHTEYMVQLCENGLIGFTIFLLFYYSIFKRIIRNSKDRTSFFAVFIFISLLFLNLTTWTYNSTWGMIYYAILTWMANVAETQKNKSIFNVDTYKSSSFSY